MHPRSAGLLSRVRLPRRLPREPWSVLAPLLLLQWVALIAFVETIRHNRWLFYQGGDQTYFYTSAWVLAHGHVPLAPIGYAWSYVLAPLTWMFGANVLAALPVIVLLQTLVLLPVSTLAMYGIGTRLGGRIVGYLAAFWWVVGPYAAIPLWDHRYHGKYLEQFLPQGLGLTGLGDFPSTVCLLVAALLVLRSLDGDRVADAVLGGLFAGFAIGIKPANLLFLAGPALAYAAARRFRYAAAFAVALAPAVVALALWKLKGLGYLPIIAQHPTAYALAAAPHFESPPLGLLISKYTHFSWARLHNNYLQLREFFWSVRLVQWIPVAGVIAIARRSWPKALLLAGWFGAFVLVKGSSPVARVEDASFWRLFLPGLPPFVLFGAALPLLWPRTGPRLAERFRRPARPLLAPRYTLGAAAALLAVVPLLVVGVLPSLHRHNTATYFDEHVLVPIDRFDLSALAAPDGSVSLAWTPPHTEARPFYRIFRMHPVQLTPRDAVPPPARDGIRCPPKSGAQGCTFEMAVVASTRETQFVDHPPRGRWSYRVGLAANWIDDLEGGDVLLFSRAGDVTVR